jgi:dihydrolipoamide dehydrogenase
MGGRCLNEACIPAKIVLRSAEVLEDSKHAEQYGILGNHPRVDFSLIAERRESVIKGLSGSVAMLLKKNNVTVLQAEAALTDQPGQLELVGVDAPGLINCDNIILAAGSVRSSLPGIEYGKRVMGTEQAWALEDLPLSMVVLGAGASGAELASAYARLGTQVQLFEIADQILPSEEPEIAAVVAKDFVRQGITIHTATRLDSVNELQTGVQFTYSGETDDCELLVVAAGRKPDLQSLAIDKAGLQLTDSGRIATFGGGQTSREDVYAIGDLTDGPALAHKASEEGISAAEHIAGSHFPAVEHKYIPRATFCQPQVASFGWGEQEAREAGFDVVIGKASYAATGAAAVYGDSSGLVKIIADKTYGEILGAHIVGVKATELIQQLVNLKALEGGTPELSRIVHGHPTLSEALCEAGRSAEGWIIHG